MTTMRDRAIQRLRERKAKLQAAFDDLASQPASYSISGSVTATNQKLADLRNEIAVINRAIESLILDSASDGIKRTFPNYNQGGLQ